MTKLGSEAGEIILGSAPRGSVSSQRSLKKGGRSVTVREGITGMEQRLK